MVQGGVEGVTAKEAGDEDNPPCTKKPLLEWTNDSNNYKDTLHSPARLEMLKLLFSCSQGW